MHTAAEPSHRGEIFKLNTVSAFYHISRIKICDKRKPNTTQVAESHPSASGWIHIGSGVAAKTKLKRS